MPRASAPAEKIWFAPFQRDRRELLPLFRLADDSEQQIKSYLHAGEILFAAQGGHVLGYAQIIVSDHPAEFELKSIAVDPAHQRQGTGTGLVRAAIRYCRQHDASRLTVSTAIGASEAIAFYLRNGFRICGFERDAFTVERGYPVPTDGNVPLRDSVTFDLLLESVRPAPELSRRLPRNR